MVPVAEVALMMKETHEEDDPHSDNLFCLENTVSNLMPAVWQSTIDFVAMNRSSRGMSYCREKSQLYLESFKTVLGVSSCQVASCDCFTSDVICRVWLNPHPTKLSMESFQWMQKLFTRGREGMMLNEHGLEVICGTHIQAALGLLSSFSAIIEITIQLVEAKSHTMVSAFSESTCCLQNLQFHTLSFLSGMYATVS